MEFQIMWRPDPEKYHLKETILQQFPEIASFPRPQDCGNPENPWPLPYSNTEQHPSRLVPSIPGTKLGRTKAATSRIFAPALHKHIWVNYNNSPSWIVGQFGDDFPYQLAMIPGLGRTGFGRDEIYPELLVIIPAYPNIHSGTIWTNTS